MDEVRTFFAPGRVNLIGEHTDYNAGHVLPCAIDLGTRVTVKRSDCGMMKFYSHNVKGDAWEVYPRGVIRVFEDLGFEFPYPLDFEYEGNIPMGSGISSSASIEVATAYAVREMFGLDIDMEDMALLCQRAENVYAGANCGIMDQFVVSVAKDGCAVYLDTDTLRYEDIPMTIFGSAFNDSQISNCTDRIYNGSDGSFNGASYSIVITNSNVRHHIASSGYNDRRGESEAAFQIIKEIIDQNPAGFEKPEIEHLKNIKGLCHITPAEFERISGMIEDPVLKKRARHAIYENDRTVLAADALQRGDAESFGRLMYESHKSLRDDYEVSCEELDILVEQASRTGGVLGSRMTGGGFGGCTVSIVKSDAVDIFKETVEQNYASRTGLIASFYVVKPGAGVREL